MKERYSNPVVGDDVKLRVFTFNSNARRDLHEVTSVEIWYLDPNEKTVSNPDGRRLVQTFPASRVIQEETGQYSLTINLGDSTYCIGTYLDIWQVVFEAERSPSKIENGFVVYPPLWYTSTTPVVYDFDFVVRPNRLKKGSKRYLIIGISPNVPRASDLQRYYENLITTAQITISIEMECVECMPQEEDLKLVVDAQPVEYRERCTGYYMLDTTDMVCGIYNVWFEMQIADSIYISEKQQIQVY